MLEGTIIDPAIRAQLSRQYKQWYYEREHRGKRQVQPELKCNRCKQYFPREIMIMIKTGNDRKWTAYCPECLKKRKPRVSR